MAVSTRVRARCTAAAAAALATALVTACGGPPPAPPVTSGPVTGYPVEVADCNARPVALERPPTRVVPLSSPAMEFLFWLGVQDRIAATGEVPTGIGYPEQFRAQAAALEVIAEPFVPGQEHRGVAFESLLRVGADFVLTDYTSTFAAFDQDDLRQRGIPSYLTISNDCPAGLTGPQTDLRAAQKDIENLGRVFGVPERAAELIAKMNVTTDTVARALSGSTERPTVLYLLGDYASDRDPGPAYGNRSVVNAIIELAGARNVFADLDVAFQSVGWEEITARDPDVIIISSYGYGGRQDYDAIVARTRAQLATNPATRNLRAVTGGRIADVNAWLVDAAGVRSADGVAAVARIVHPGRVP